MHTRTHEVITTKMNVSVTLRHALSGRLCSLALLHLCPPILTQQPICLLSLETSLSVLEFYINEITEHVLFCIWLLSLHILILRITCVLWCVNSSFLSLWNSFLVFVVSVSLFGSTRICYSIEGLSPRFQPFSPFFPETGHKTSFYFFKNV